MDLFEEFRRASNKPSTRTKSKPKQGREGEMVGKTAVGREIFLRLDAWRHAVAESMDESIGQVADTNVLRLVKDHIQIYIE